jgi:regulator of protease activity HflC (stomatin/prohibitin superfamily)
MIGYIIGGIGILALFGFSGIRIIRPTERAAVETLGKYTKYCTPGFNWIVPLVQRMIKVEITEQMTKVEPQDIITQDNLNAKVDLVVYYKVLDNEQSIKNALYKVQNWESQIIMLAKTTARSVIGDMAFKNVNSQRLELNGKLAKAMTAETKTWGVEIVRVELKEIMPPADVQDTMNKVIMAENTKRAAIDFATARETEADGMKRAKIKEAEGIGQGRVIVAEAQAKAIKLVNESADKYFKGNAQKLKQLEVAQESLKNNTKIVLGADNNSVLKMFNIDK